MSDETIGCAGWREAARFPVVLPRGAALWAMLAGLAFFLAVRAHIDFPSYYHWDEGGKAEQVLTGRRNLNHPPLLLNAARAVHDVTRGTATVQAATRSGRLCAAGFAAVAVALFAWLAYRLAGGAAALCAGALVAAQPLLFELAHYFKEDTCLLAGWAAALAAAEAYTHRPSRVRAMLVGAGAALALSGKYIGILPALAVVVLTGGAICRRERTWQERALRMGLLLLTAMLLLAAVNYQALLATGAVVRNIETEVRKQLHHDTGANIWVQLWLQNGAAVLALSVAGVVLAPAFRRPFRPAAWTVVGVAVLYVLMVSLVRRSVPRYLLPVGVSLAWLAGVGAGALLSGGLSAWPRRAGIARLAAGGLLLAAGLAHLGLQTLAQAKAFASRGTRAALQDHIAQHLPASAVVAYDVRVLLPDPQHPERTAAHPPLRQRVVGIPFWNPARGPSILAWLREQGATHVAVVTHYADIYLAPGFHATEGQFSDQPYRREFYLHLRRAAPLVWEHPGMANKLVAPGLRLYALTNGPAAAP